jgi:hypothetical protein
MQDAGIKLTSVASQAYSKSARAMLEALLSGVTKPEELAELAKARLRSKIPQLREALANRFQVDHHGILVAQLLAHIDTLDQAIATLDERVEAMLAPHAKIVELLCTIPGVAVRTAQVLIAECEVDMSRFTTAAPGAIEPCWSRERVLDAMRTRHELHGRLPTSYDWSRTHARRRGDEALARLTSGRWPSASVVTTLFGSWRAARSAMSSRQDVAPE